MKIMKEKMKKIVCGTLSFVLSAGILTGCSMFERVEDSETPYSPIESVVPDPTPSDPDPEKTVTGEEIDALGHKIVYYSDGTWEDLGRVVALDYFHSYEEKYGYRLFKQEENGADLCGFYEALYLRAKNFTISGETPKKEDGHYEAATVSYVNYDLTSNEALKVWKTFAYENPAFFWIDNTVSYTDEMLSLMVTSDYAKGETRTALQAEIESFALECDGYLNGKMSVFERVLTIHDYLASKVEYAYEDDGVTPENDAWAHNLVGVTLGKGVCETYAKAFDYLCNLFEIECSFIAGMSTQEGAEGGHAWNMFKLDEKWYLADVTWDDLAMFLSREWLGMLPTDFAKTHIADTPDNTGIDYQYPLPTFAEEELCPVLFGEEDGQTTLLSSVDEAFKNMTNDRGRYEITLYPNSKITEKFAMDIWPVGACAYTNPPPVKALTVKAKILYANEDKTSYYPAELTTVKPFKLSSDITFINVEFAPQSLVENGYDILIKTER